MAESAPSESNTADIVRQMQVLTDIEGDLADTAVAVTAPDASFDQVVGTGSGSSSSDTMMQNAEAVESLLEQSIPSAPDPATEEPPSAHDSQIQINGDESEAALPTVSASAVQDLSTTVSAVVADLNVPILPENVVAAAHDVTLVTPIEESTGDSVVQVEPPTTELIIEAVSNGDASPAPTQSDPTMPSNSVAVPPLQVSESQFLLPPTQQSNSSSVPTQALLQVSTIGLKRDISLPDGLSSSSPSVLAVPDLIRSWKVGTPRMPLRAEFDALVEPKNPHILLALFDWSVQKTEINDARAWYNALSTDNPTAVNRFPSTQRASVLRSNRSSLCFP